MKKNLILIVLILLFNNSTVMSKEVTGKIIKESAREWLKSKDIEENISLLAEVRYPNCENLIFSSISLKNNLIKVFCEKPNQWSFILRNNILKPKKIEKKKKIYNRNEIEVIVLNRDMKRGEIIRPNDINRLNIVGSYRGIAMVEEEVLGKKIKNNLKANKQIYLKNLEKEWMIEKNNKIVFENNSKFIRIKIDVIALENGDLNDRIRVKNTSSGEILTGFIKNNKKVTMKPKQF